MRKLLFALLLSLSLEAAGFWTLTGLEKANIYVKNDVSLIKPRTVTLIKKKMATALHDLGVKTKQQDSPTLIVMMEDIEDEGTHYVYLKLALGEQVQTFRKDKSTTFALTYAGYDFIDVDEEEMDKEVLESVDFLLSQFKEQFEDDNE